MDIVVGLVAAFVLARFFDGRVAIALAVVVVVGRRLWLHRRGDAVIDSTGLSRAEFAQVKQDLARGDHAAAEQRIAAAQERNKAVPRTAGINVDAITPMIGREIGWVDIVGQVFRVRGFDRAGTTIGPDGQVRASSATEPYGYLVVESPILNQAAALPITHSTDFGLASSVFDEPTLAHIVTDAELLVTYVPKHKLPGGLAGVTHALHYVIVPPGTLQRYYEVGGDVHMTKPAPQKLFRQLTYEGELRVQVNRDPQL
jgi:hypothetical protein